MTEIMSYRKAVLEIREAVANRDSFIISGIPQDIATFMAKLGEKKCTIWINADFGEGGVFKLESSEVDGMSGITRAVAMITSLFSMNMGLVVSVPKTEKLPDELGIHPGKDLFCLNGQFPILAAEAMRTLWPDETVLEPEETLAFSHSSVENQA